MAGRKYVREQFEDNEINLKCCPRTAMHDELSHRNIDESYYVLQKLGSGTYGSVVLAICKKTRAKVALKLLLKSSIKERDFWREFSYSYYLSPHRSVAKTYDFAFQTDSQFVFAQEYAPYGDLFDVIPPQVGLTEERVKNVAGQIASALAFIHSLRVVHRDIKPENVLVFDPDLKLVKLTDFGMAKRVGTMVRKVSPGIPYTPPEICEALRGERYIVECQADVWAFGVLLFCCLTGNFPWELACHRDNFFTEYYLWFKKHTHTVPSQWRRFSSRLLKFLRQLMHLVPSKRCAITETDKNLSYPWICKISSKASTGNNSTGTTDTLTNEQNTTRTSDTDALLGRCSAKYTTLSLD